jgi:hypothetical protein
VADHRPPATILAELRKVERAMLATDLRPEEFERLRMRSMRLRKEYEAAADAPPSN